MLILADRIVHVLYYEVLVWMLGDPASTRTLACLPDAECFWERDAMGLVELLDATRGDETMEGVGLVGDENAGEAVLQVLLHLVLLVTVVALDAEPEHRAGAPLHVANRTDDESAIEQLADVTPRRTRQIVDGPTGDRSLESFEQVEELPGHDRTSIVLPQVTGPPATIQLSTSGRRHRRGPVLSLTLGGAVPSRTKRQK